MSQLLIITSVTITAVAAMVAVTMIVLAVGVDIYVAATVATDAPDRSPPMITHDSGNMGMKY